MFTGSGVALVTPMKDDKVNYEKIQELVADHIEKGTDAIIMCGTTGESSTLSHEEHLQCVKVALEAAEKKIPVIAGTGKNSTRDSIKLSIDAQDLGADALLVVTPYYNKTSQRGLVEHYRAIGEAVEIPIIVYNVPSRTGLNVEPETMAKLCELPNISGLKDAGSNIVKTAETVRFCGNRLTVYSGNDSEVIPILSLGGKGVISVLANIAPTEIARMVHNHMNGQPRLALSTQLSFLPLIAALFSEVNPIPIKAAMNLLGYDVGKPRLPLVEMTSGAVGKLKMVMLGHGFNIEESRETL